MRHRPRTLAVALAVSAGAIAGCVIVPLIDPMCGLGVRGAGPLGPCGVSQFEYAREVARLGLTAGAAIVALLAASVTREAFRHHQLSSELRRVARPALLLGHRVGLVPGTRVALVAGIRRPRIYCSADMVAALEDEELQAVLLHEHHHQLVRAPARLVVLAALRPLVGFLRPGAAWLERQRARIEVSADEHAIGAGATRATLARAIVKLQHGQSIPELAAFASASELRVRALLGEGTPELVSATRIPLSLISAAAAAAALCAAVSLV